MGKEQAPASSLVQLCLLTNHIPQEIPSIKDSKPSRAPEPSCIMETFGAKIYLAGWIFCSDVLFSNAPLMGFKPTLGSYKVIL